MIRVLLVNDDQAELDGMSGMLSSEGDVSVDVALSGEAALDKLSMSDFDAVISDYLSPPVMNGIDLLRNARARGYRNLFLMLTDKDDEGVALDAILNGADHFLPKGGSQGRDVALIRSILRKRVQLPQEDGDRRMAAYRSILMRIQDGFAYNQIIHGISGDPPTSMIVDANEAMERILSPSGDSILGQNVRHLLHHEDGFETRLAKAIDNVMSTGEGCHFIERSGTRDRWYSVTIDPPEVDHFAIIISDITGLRRAEEEVQRMQKKVAILGSSVRHDVMNQLTALNGFITLSQLKIEDRSIQEYLNKAAISGGRIRKILEMSREYEQLGTSPPQWISAQEAAERGIGQVKHEGTAVHVELNGLEVMADPHLDMVFRVLYDNACRHGHAPEVRFFRERNGHDVKIVCHDNGEGIPPEKRKVLFNDRPDHSLSLVKEGLSITGMRIEERPKEKGACFEILVPRGTYRLV